VSDKLERERMLRQAAEELVARDKIDDADVPVVRIVFEAPDLLSFGEVRFDDLVDGGARGFQFGALEHGRNDDDPRGVQLSLEGSEVVLGHANPPVVFLS